MLDIYKDGQAIAYNTMMNAINNNKISHAYLFDSNGNPDVMDIVLSFVKSIVCLEYNDENNAIKVCKRIDEGNYLDVMVIEPDGLWIKKNQIIDLQNEFSKKAVEGRKKIYIIKSADKMNVQTANSILKFLEEPEDNIVAILVSDNVHQLLDTIVSRCQLISLTNKNDNLQEYYTYKLFNNKFQVVFPGEPSLQEIPKELLNPKEMGKTIPYKYRKELNTAKITLKRKGESLELYMGENKIVEIPTAIPATTSFNSLKFIHISSDSDLEKYYISNFKITKQ